MFDLTARISSAVVESSCSSSQLRFIPVSLSESAPYTREVLLRIGELLGADQSDSITRSPLRLCIPSLGSPQWGDLGVHVRFSFVSRRHLSHILEGHLRLSTLSAGPSETPYARSCRYISITSPMFRIMGRKRMDAKAWVVVRHMHITVRILR